MVELITITTRGQITIPAGIRKALGLESGGKAVISKIGASFTVHPLSSKKDVMELYGSLIPPKGNVIDPDKAIALAKKLKAQEDAKS